MLCYRYMSYERFLQSIKTNGVFFKVSRPMEFNDPYDCNGVIEGKMSQYLKETYSDAFQQTLYPEESDLAYKVNGRRMFDRMYRILSLSGESVRGSAGEALMWSHYADGARGVRIGVDVDIDRYRLGIVEYKTSLPVLDLSKVEEWRIFDDHELRRFLKACLLTKNEVWEYEKEHRIVFRVNDENLKPFSIIDASGPIEDAMMIWTPAKDVVKEICLGAEILQVTKNYNPIKTMLSSLKDAGYDFEICHASQRKNYGYNVSKYQI